MASPSLQRSGETFRRSGSSGLVWEDRFMAEEGIKAAPADPAGGCGRMQRSSSAGADSSAYLAAKGPPPAADPPSPKVAGCGFCAVFASPKPKPRRRR
ncbi:plant/protein [Wolffia australiana]